MGKAKASGRPQLWAEVLRGGLAGSESEARALVMAGAILVDGHRVDKPGTPVPAGAEVRRRGRRDYASRGGDKLAAALTGFGIEVSGRVALDAGASTGGFTDCLLRRGAARVYAVDVGFGQLLGRLRQDPRVVNLERTNLADITPAALQPPPTLVTLDLSYLPLASAWDLVSGWLSSGGEVVSLVKPLFEVDDPVARRTGRIDGAAAYVGVLTRLADAARALHWRVQGVMASPVRGSRGTIEFLLHTRVGAGWSASALSLAEVVAEALSAAAGAPGQRPADRPTGR